MTKKVQVVLKNPRTDRVEINTGERKSLINEPQEVQTSEINKGEVKEPVNCDVGIDTRSFNEVEELRLLNSELLEENVILRKLFKISEDRLIAKGMQIINLRGEYQALKVEWEKFSDRK